MSIAAPPVASSSSSATPSRALNIGLWVAQVLLAVAFGMAGTMKTTKPIAELVKAMPWVSDAPALIRFIGLAELAGSLGLLLPSLTRIKPRLTPLAALGLVVVMVLAALFHIARGEVAAVPVNLALGGLAAFVAWGRGRKAPIGPRS